VTPKILGQLDEVREAGRDQWTAACPNHPDLRITVFSSDGLGLVAASKCGCSEGAIYAAVKGREVSQTAREKAPPLFEPVADFLARCGQAIDYILAPYVPRSGFVIVGGAPKSGKTWFLSWLACKISEAGRTVMFVEEEGAPETLRARLAPFLQPDSRIMVAHRRGVRLDDVVCVSTLVEALKASAADVLFLDPLTLLHSHNRQIGEVPAEVIQAIATIIRETGCAVVLAHHTRKGASWDKADSSDAQSADLAGSYAWAASADNIIQIKALPPARRSPGEVSFYVENPDTRNGEPFAKKIATVRVEADGAKAAMTFTEPEADRSKVLRALLPHVPAAPGVITVEDLRERAGMGKGRVQSAIDFGLETGELVRVPGKGGGVQRKSHGPDHESPLRSVPLRTADPTLKKGPRPGPSESEASGGVPCSPSSGAR
jgi:AAA domain